MDDFLYVLKQKIIKTDAVINLLAESTNSNNVVQEKLENLTDKYVEKCKEIEVLRQNFDSHKILLDRATEKLKNYEQFKDRHTELNGTYKKDINLVRLKYQQVSEELDSKYAENEALSRAHTKLEETVSETKDVKFKNICTGNCELTISRQAKQISELKDAIQMLEEGIQKGEAISDLPDQSISRDRAHGKEASTRILSEIKTRYEKEKCVFKRTIEETKSRLTEPKENFEKVKNENIESSRQLFELKLENSTPSKEETQFEVENVDDLEEIDLDPLERAIDKEKPTVYAESVEKEIDKFSKQYERDMSEITKKLQQLERNELVYKEMFEGIIREKSAFVAKATECCDSLITNDKVLNLKQSPNGITITNLFPNESCLDSDCSVTSEYVEKILKASRASSNFLTDINTDFEGNSLSCGKVKNTKGVGDAERHLNVSKIIAEMKTIPSILFPMELTDNEATSKTGSKKQWANRPGNYNRTKYFRRLKFELNRQKLRVFSSTSESETCGSFRRRRKRIRRNLDRKGEISETSDNGTDTPESSSESNFVDKPIIEKENIYEIEQKSVDSGCAVSDSDIVETKLIENVSSYPSVHDANREKIKILENIILYKPGLFGGKTYPVSLANTTKKSFPNGNIPSDSRATTSVRVAQEFSSNLSSHESGSPHRSNFLTPVKLSRVNETSGNTGTVSTDDADRNVLESSITSTEAVDVGNEYSVNEQLNKIHVLTRVLLSFSDPHKESMPCSEERIASKRSRSEYYVDQLPNRIDTLTPILMTCINVRDETSTDNVRISDIDEIKTNTSELIGNLDDYKEILNDSILSNFDSVKECVVGSAKRPASSCLETKAKKQRISLLRHPKKSNIFSLDDFESFAANFNDETVVSKNNTHNLETVESSLIGTLETNEKLENKNNDSFEGTIRTEKNVNEVLFKISHDSGIALRGDAPLYRKIGVRDGNILETSKNVRHTNEEESLDGTINCRKDTWISSDTSNNIESRNKIVEASENLNKRKYNEKELFGSDSDSTCTSLPAKQKKLARTKPTRIRKNYNPPRIIPEEGKEIVTSKISDSIRSENETSAASSSTEETFAVKTTTRKNIKDAQRFKRPSSRERTVDTIQSPPHETNFESSTENIKKIPLERAKPITFGKHSFSMRLPRERTVDTIQSPPHETNFESSTENIKIIPLERAKPITFDHAYKSFEKLLCYPKDEEILEEVANTFLRQETNHVASLVLRMVSVNVDEKLDRKYSPPAPVMTETQQTLQGLMCRLEGKGMNFLLDSFLRRAELRLLKEKNVSCIRPITRLYVAVCKQQNCIERLKVFCCDAVYLMEDHAIPFLFVVLSNWADILPKEPDTHDQPLWRMLVQIVNTKSCIQPGFSLENLKIILTKYHMYPNERWSENELFANLLENFKNHPSRTTELPILLLCKYNPSKWTLSRIENDLKPLIEDKSNSKLMRSVITLIARLASQFDAETDVDLFENLKSWSDRSMSDPAQ